MPVTLDDRLTIAISSRTLFNLEESHQVFRAEGVEAYSQYQIAHEGRALEPGIAFPLVRKLLALNNRTSLPLVEVILLSRNSADTGLRVFNSIEHHGLDITRAAFTNGAAPWRYIAAFGADLFLSADPQDVGNALQAGCAAAALVPAAMAESPWDQIRIAFDGDAVLVSDEAERVYQASGLAAFKAQERDAAREPLSGGPFKDFLGSLHRLQNAFPADESPLRTALVTARDAPAHERIIRTLRDWEVRLDEALFLGGMDKTPFLKAFGADIFFDDQRRHVERAAAEIATGHVLHGIANEGQ